MMANEAKVDDHVSSMKSNEINNNIASHKTPSYPKSNEKEVKSTKLTSPMFAKKSKLLEDLKPANGNATQSNTSIPTASSSGIDSAKLPEASPVTSNIGNKNQQPVKTVEPATTAENIRPSNPFAKTASTSQKSYSLLESLKKRKADGNLKR